MKEILASLLLFFSLTGILAIYLYSVADLPRNIRVAAIFGAVSQVIVMATTAIYLLVT